MNAALRALALLGGLAVGGCATNPVTGRPDLVLMSEQQEVALGRQAHEEILKRYRVYPDPALQNYVAEVGQRIAANAHRQDIGYRFTLLDSTEINAFALPGGYIYITRGLLAYLNSEAELAAVLGHELGHVTARHSVRQQSAAQAASLGTGLLSIFFPQLGYAGLGQTIDLLGSALLRGYGREMELEADGLGAEYLARAGYAPEAMLAVIGTLKNQEIFDRELAAAEGREPRAYHGLFATHPSNDTRLAEAIANGRRYAREAGEVQRDRFLDRVDGLTFGDDPREGITRGEHFFHAGLDFALDLPDGWTVDNLPDRLALTAPGSNAQIQLATRAVAPGTSAGDFVRELRLADFTAARALDIHGRPAVSGFARVQAGGRALPARIVALVHGGNGYVFTGVARDPDALGSFDAQMLAFAQSFRPLSAAERKQIRPTRVRVVQPPAGVAWKTLASGSPLRRQPEAQLRLLNAAPAAASGPTSTRVKIID
jgi:predicted Zn-dependent protease